MANNFINSDSNIDKYFLKIAPDFSVLYLAEKFMIENNKDGEYNFFFYKNFTETHSNFKFSFKRMLIRIPIKQKDAFEINNGSFKSFDLNDYHIIIAISETEDSLSADITSAVSVVGVGF